MKRYSLMVCLACAAAWPATAEIIAAGPDHYELRHEAASELAPEAVWDRLIQPETWWAPAHTYSGQAENLSLDPQAGGLWREDWEAGSVRHGEVLMVREGEQLRLDAPFGPLQGLGVEVVWTITIAREGEGSRIVFEEIASGSAASGLDQVAPAVDGVKQQAITRLAAARIDQNTGPE